MTRNEALAHLTNNYTWDLLVIGGGASGLGVALDAVSRNFRVLLIDKYDFGKATSSKSTKLVHGGVRYLQQGNVSLVREALHERAYILSQANHNAHVQPFIIPFFSIWMGIYYYFGLKMYNILSGNKKIGKTRWLKREKTLSKLPNLKQVGLKGGILYHDGQFDDGRMCIDLVRTIQDKGGICINYFSALEFIKEDGQIIGVVGLDEENGQTYQLLSKTVINATGIFTDEILKKESSEARKTIIPSRGSHIVIDKRFLVTDHAIMIPKTTDGRILFMIPWLQKLIIGTTDIKTTAAVLEPIPHPDEISFILENACNYLTIKPEKKDIEAVYAGLRPLAAPSTQGKKTKEISRHHQILSTSSGLYSLIGGKWTTFRKMGQDVLDRLITDGRLDHRASTSYDIPILRPEKAEIEILDNGNYNYDEESISYFMDKEMALHVEDILARRTRLLLLNVKDAKEKITVVADIMQKLLSESDEWREREIIHCNKLFTNYAAPFVH